jgi:hypothetical protein
MNDHANAWARWSELHRLRTQNPYDVAKEFLREAGYIIERPESLSLPVQVARTGSFTEAGGFRITLHVRATIGDRKAQCDCAVDAHTAYRGMSIKAISGSVTEKFRRMIVDELRPGVEAGMDRELRIAMESGDGSYF